MKIPVVPVIFISIISLYCNANKIITDPILSLANKKATLETQTLYTKLNNLSSKGYLFGHQDDLAYGVNWKYEPGRSDIKDVVGDYPAVYGWDIAGIEHNSPNNIDGVPFIKMKQYIQEANERGGISTISWHLDNPATNKNAWDNKPQSLKTILPGAINHQKYISWLDNAAIFLLSLKDKNDKLIPVLFRPYHELTGGWFWWGKGNCSPEDFKNLWRFTFEYFQKKGVNNLIFIYNTGGFNSEQDFMENYPGSNYVDILSFDAYQTKDDASGAKFIKEVQSQFKIIAKIGKSQNKPIALAETGYEAIPDPKWWTGTLSKAIGQNKISYVLVWRNHGWQEKEKNMHYYAPYKGQTSESDFIEYYHLRETLFEKDLQ